MRSTETSGVGAKGFVSLASSRQTDTQSQVAAAADYLSRIKANVSPVTVAIALTALLAVSLFFLYELTRTLHEARAFSASLGMTTQGTVDLDQQSLDLQGTIVPAYFFNTLLGDIPLIGRLFSPERGGGVFSATYAVRGPLNDPSVSVNPLAALTPGVLRKLFGIFDSAK